MNKKYITETALYGLLIFGIVGSGSLVLNEFSEGHICPQLLGIPACYIIFLAFLGLFLLHLLKYKNIYFYILAGIPLSLAVYGTIFQIIGRIECPKTEGGIPMCYISLALFSTIVILKFLLSKSKND